MEEKVQQLNILLQTIKDIVKSRNCPEWIAKKLTDSVKRAKELQPAAQSTQSESYTVDTTFRPFEINENVISNVNNDECLYKIIEQADPVGGVNLYHLQIIRGNKNNPTGLIVHNVPETMLQHIIGYQDIV